MQSSNDQINLTLPRSILPELPALSADLASRMHGLLERNTDGLLSESERAELETLVQIAQVAQVLAMVVRPPGEA